jgi:hypothetical protein
MDYAAFHNLEVRVRQLEEIVAKLQGIAPPKPMEEVKYEPVRFDPLANATMPSQVMAEMSRLDCGNPMEGVRALSAGRGMIREGSPKDSPGQQRANGTEDAPRVGRDPIGTAHERAVIDAIGGKGGK